MHIPKPQGKVLGLHKALPNLVVDDRVPITSFFKRYPLKVDHDCLNVVGG